MGKFFGSIIGAILSKVLIMGAVVVGGQYFLSQNGGVAGLLGGGGGPTGGGMAQPISAGIGGIGAIASTLGIGGGGGGDSFEVQGRISDVRIECRLVGRSNGRSVRTEPLSCDRARMALTHAQFADHEVTESRTATYIYYALDGVTVLKGKADARRGHKVGDVIDLRIDRADPRKSTPI